ncbi:MAG: DNA-binding response regulator [Pseudomonadota bacterium]|nr:DNA-binding response regulator [Pseudomonadota bacterium]
MSQPAQQIACVYNPQSETRMAEVLAEDYQSIVGDSLAALEAHAGEATLLVLDLTTGAAAPPAELCASAKQEHGFAEVPVIVYQAATAPVDTMACFDGGADDVVDDSMPAADLRARLSKAVFHKIANQQLQSRLQQASAMAFSAMSDSSDLGVNIQFLVHCHSCNNLDELAMLLFSTLEHYQLNCSLQLRSTFEVKNTEPNGLAKDLESRLLWELKDRGRYVDFGRRCVMNYGCVSLLVKNMPEDEKRFGAIKDNVFALLQGTDARVHSIDNSRLLEMERDVMKGMSTKMQNVMEQVDERYQQVMRRCADLVEDMAVRVDESILFLDLTEAQEETFSNIMQSGVTAISELFNEGIKIDNSFRKLVEYMNNTLASEEAHSVEALKSVLNRL